MITNPLKKLTKRLELLNLSESWEEEYKPVKNEITQCTEDIENPKKNLKWLTQYHFGCLLFSLLNGNFVDSKFNSLFDFNLDFSHPVGKSITTAQIIKGVVHEYKAILLWYLFTGIKVLDAGSLRCMHDMIHEMLNSTSKKKICELAWKLNSICTYENRFAVKFEKGRKLDFASQGWKFLGEMSKIMEETREPKYLAIKLRYLERLPKFSAVCFDDHWVIFFRLPW